jgi:hypothetical protein
LTFFALLLDYIKKIKIILYFAKKQRIKKNKIMDFHLKMQIMAYFPQIVLVFCVIICFIIIIIKVKYGFWSHQPVFHVYDILYYIWSKGIIESDLPKPNKFTNFNKIKTYSWMQVSNLQLNEFVAFVREHYWQQKENKFAPLRENVVPYFDGFSSKCYISFYKEQNPCY